MILPLTRALTRSAGAAAFRAAGPLYAGIAVVAAILFGPHGMSAADAVTALDGSTPLRLGLWAGWLLAATPAARLVFETPDTFYLRALPVPRWKFCAVHAAHLAALQAPWILLHARGGGWQAAAGATSLSVGGHALLCARTVRPQEVAAGGLLLLAASQARMLEIPAGIAAAVIGTRSAFRRAPERRARRKASRVCGPAVVALALSYLVAVPRQAPAAIVRALLVTAAGAAFAGLAVRNNQLADPGAIAAVSLGVLTTFTIIATGGIDRAVAAAERATGWILASTGTARAMQRAAAAGAVSLWAAACGLLHGIAVAAGLGVGAGLVAGLVTLGAGWAAATAAIIALVRRRRT